MPIWRKILLELKRERNAANLAHNYQVRTSDIADFVGDSLGLSYQAAKNDADVILFWCSFHSETAKIIIRHCA